MKERTRNMLVGLAILLFILLILWLLFGKGRRSNEPVGEPREPDVVTEVPSEPRQLAPAPTRTLPQTSEQASAHVVARMFAERYASFSAASNFANLRDLLPLMTDVLRAQVEEQMNSAEASGAYYGVSSRLMALHERELSDGRAVFDADLQRVESVGSPSNTSTKYETLRIELVARGGSWLVSAVNWQ